MKKVLVVLLIAVLAVGSVFADVTGFSGSLTSTLTYDTDAEALTFRQTAEASGSFSFNLYDGSKATASKQGEGYPYAIIEGALSIDFEDYEFTFGDVGYTRYTAKDAFWDQQFTGEIKDGTITGQYFDSYDVRVMRYSWSTTNPLKVITTAKIVGEKWELDLLKNFGVGNFATNPVADAYKFEASKKVSKSVAFDMDNSTSAGNGVTFTYDGYSVAVNQFTFKDGGNDVELSLQTKDFDFDGVTGTVAANFHAKGDDKYLGLSAKAGYEVEDIDVDGAVDVDIAFEGDSRFDGALSADYKDGAVKFDFYYASKAWADSPYTENADVNKAVFNLSFDYTDDPAVYNLKFKNSGDAIGASYYEKVGKSYYIEKLMSLKAVVDVAKLADLGPVSALSVTVDGHDILNKDFTAADAYNHNAYAWNAEANAAVEDYGTTAKFGVKSFTVDARRFYAEATTDFAKFVELPVNSLTLKVGSNDIDMDKNTSSIDCLYVEVASEINDDLSLTVKGNQLAGIDRTDKVGVAATYKGIENLTLSAEVTHLFAKESTKKTTIDASAEYEHDLFTATAKVSSSIIPDGTNTFGIYLGAVSTEIVHGAKLSLEYAPLDSDGDVTNDWVAENYGNVVAKCVIEF